MMDSLLWDLRYAARQLLRSPGFTLAAALTLTLGIGANTIVFSIVNGMLLRPLPVEQPDAVVGLYATNRRAGDTRNLSYPEYLDYRDRSGVFTGLAASLGVPLSLAGDERAEMVWGEIVTEDYFSVLRLEPALGRTFLPADASGPGSDPLAVLSHRVWLDRFQGDSGVIGKVVRLNGHPFTIVGVAPAGFRGVRRFSFWPEVWVPMMMHAQVMPGSEGILDDRASTWLIVVGRLRPGLTKGAASDALTDFAGRLEQTYPESHRDRGARLLSGRSGFDDPDFTPIRVLVLSAALAMSAVGLILLLACTNVANLLLARASARGREIALRLALGAGRARLMRQFLTESLLLSAIGGGAGVALASWTGEIQAMLVPRLQFPVGFEVSLDRRVLAFGLVLSVLTSFLFGLAPGLHAARYDVTAMLKGQGERARPSRWGLDFRSLLVIGQVALSLVLLIAGGLFLKSFLNARALDVGLVRDHRLLLSLDPGLQGYDSARSQLLYRGLLDRVREIPEVSAASLSFPLPLDTYGRNRSVFIEGDASATDGGTLVIGTSVTAPGYFGAVGTTLLQGRDFAAADSATAVKVAVVNQTMAALLGGGRDVIGREFRLEGPEGERVRVIGVARDGKYGTIGESPQPYIYLPLSQHPSTWLTLVVRTRGDPTALIPAIREAVHRLDPDLAPFG
jgi:predicted permease